MPKLKLRRRWIGVVLAFFGFVALVIVGQWVKATNDHLISVRSIFRNVEKEYVSHIFLRYSERLSSDDATDADYQLVKKRLRATQNLKSWTPTETDLGYVTDASHAPPCREDWGVYSHGSSGGAICDGSYFVLQGPDPLERISVTHVPDLHLLEVKMERPVSDAEIWWTTLRNGGRNPVRKVEMSWH